MDNQTQQNVIVYPKEKELRLLALDWEYKAEFFVGLPDEVRTTLKACAKTLRSIVGP